jgi:hypothetical protein
VNFVCRVWISCASLRAIGGSFVEESELAGDLGAGELRV